MFGKSAKDERHNFLIQYEVNIIVRENQCLFISEV